MNTELTTIKQSLSEQEFKESRNGLIKFVKSQLKEAKDIGNGGSGDYGIIPYTKKMSLLKPGAEKLLKLFGFTAHFELVKEIEEWDKRFVYYRYRCVITHAASGTFIADAVRSCNSKEKKHSTKDVYDVANTIESVAQKRALVAATVQATMASEIFDADVSESDDEAPKRTVTKEEDPRRNRLFASLYKSSSNRGLDDNWLHKAAKKRFNIIESLTEISNNQIEELTELVCEHYEEVEKGEAPKLKNQVTLPTIKEVSEEEVNRIMKPLEQAVEKLIEVTDQEENKINCYQCDKVVPEERDTTSPYFCSSECQNKYYPNKKDEKTRFQFKKGLVLDSPAVTPDIQQ